MKTLFECWNAGVAEWDGISSPKLGFPFPVRSKEILAFFLVSARLNQLLSKQEWQLSFAGRAYAVPPFPSQEMCRALAQIPSQFGYSPLLHLTQPSPKQGAEYVLSQLRWVHLASGSVSSYSPFVGERLSQSRCKKPKNLVMASCEQLGVRFNRYGHLEGAGGIVLMERLGICSSLSYQTAYMLQQYFKAQQGGVRVGY